MKNNTLGNKSYWKIKGNRFHENDTMWPGISLGLEIKEILYHKRSEYQDILVFKSKTFGNILVLDGVIQITQRDESAYQEMLAHLPLFSHKNPKKVLIIGGGDLGITREVLKHKSIKNISLCEIDKEVIDVSKKYLPKISQNYNNKKLKIIIGDGYKYLKQNKDKFDIIIIDSSDPIGPANTLFTKKFYSQVKNNLNKGGIVAIQGESLFLHKNIASNLKNIMGGFFKYTYYSQVHVPTYPGGNIGLLICGNERDIRKPIREIPKEIKISLKYYSSDIHKASFVLPPSYKV